MAGYRDELDAAQEQGKRAHAAMDAWVARPLDAPDVPEKYSKGTRGICARAASAYNSCCASKACAMISKLPS